jgi:hypothetical protein
LSSFNGGRVMKSEFKLDIVTWHDHSVLLESVGILRPWEGGSLVWQ